MSDEEVSDDDYLSNNSDNENDITETNTDNIEDDIEDEEDKEDNKLNDLSDIFINDESPLILNNNKITKPFLTKYEKVRILGLRTKQLSMGAKPLVKFDDFLSPEEIADLEYKNNIIPFKIKRPLPNGTFELWKFSELKNI